MQKTRKGIPENLVRSELIAVAHHRDRDKARRPSPCACLLAIELSIDKGLEGYPTPRVPQQRQDALPIGRVQPDHRVGPRNRALSRTTTGRPAARRLLWRVGGLGDDIGNAENICNLRAQPVRRLMIKVIGKPKLRSSVRRLAAPAKKTRRKSCADRGYPSLAHRVAAPVIAAKSGGYQDVVASHPQGREEELRDPSVSRKNWMIGRFQRRVKGDTHSSSCAAFRRLRETSPGNGRTGSLGSFPHGCWEASPKRLASKSMPASIEKRDRTRRSPAAPSQVRFAGSRIRRSSASASAIGLPGGTSRPVTSCSINSGIAETSVETQASRWLCASISTLGRPSRSPSFAILEASTKKSASR